MEIYAYFIPINNNVRILSLKFMAKPSYTMYCDYCEDSFFEETSENGSETDWNSDSDCYGRDIDFEVGKPLQRQKAQLFKSLRRLQEDHYYSQNIYAQICARSILNDLVYSTDVRSVFSHPIYNRSRDDSFTALRRRIDYARILSRRMPPVKIQDAEIYSPNWKKAHRPLAMSVREILFDYSYYHLGFLDEDHEMICAELLAEFEASKHGLSSKRRHQKRHQTRGKKNKSKIQFATKSLESTLTLAHVNIFRFEFFSIKIIIAQPHYDEYRWPHGNQRDSCS